LRSNWRSIKDTDPVRYWYNLPATWDFPGAFHLAVVFIAGILLAGCVKSQNIPFIPNKGPLMDPPRPSIEKPAGPEDLINDGKGLLDTATRLCSYIATRGQREMGLELANKAVDTLRNFGSPDLFKAALIVKARCCVMKADWERKEEDIESVTEAGMQAAKEAGAAESNPIASYYLALNLGLYVKTKGMKAIFKVGELIQVLKVAGIMPDLELGGPVRVLGLLYVMAPSWPAGPGDLDEGLSLLKGAVDNYPSHPLNHLFYAEALIQNKEMKKAEKELDAAVELADTLFWGDYGMRWKAEAAVLRKKL
jgi:hypothetical protein